MFIESMCFLTQKTLRATIGQKRSEETNGTNAQEPDTNAIVFICMHYMFGVIVGIRLTNVLPAHLNIHAAHVVGAR